MVPETYLPFAPIARDRMNLQCQYAVRYLFRTDGYTFLGSGIRTYGTRTNYHEIKIHAADVETFLTRYATELQMIRERECEWINEERMLRQRPTD